MKIWTDLAVGLAVVIAGAWVYDNYVKGRDWPVGQRANG